MSRTADEFVKYHGKYIVIDDTLHLLGFNFTKRDLTRTRSFGIRTRDRRAVQDAIALFESDLTRQPFSMTRRVAARGEPRDRTPCRLNGGSSAHANTGDLRRAARRSRLRQADPAARSRRRRGADHRQGAEAREGRTGPAAEESAALHVRAIIRDGTHAFVGSQSLRRLELDDRREVGLIITNPSVARRMLQIFEADWEASAKKKEQDQAPEAAAANAPAQGGNP